MADLRKHSNTSNLMRFVLKNSSTGAGLTGLTSASSGLVISTIADVEAAATAYTAAGSTVETISTLGTFATPTATKCRFKEVDATNHPGLYEFQFADARFAVSNARRLVVSVSGATNLLATDYEVRLVRFDPDDAVRMGLTALPNAAAAASGGLPTVDAGNRVKADLDTIKTQAITCAAGVTVLASVGTAATSTAQTGDSYARLGPPAGVSHAADVAAVKAETASIQSDTNDVQARLPAALVSGRMDSYMGAVNAALLGDPLDVADLVDLIWDEPKAGHATANTYGAYLDAAVSAGGAAPTAGEVATAVWDAAPAGVPMSDFKDQMVDALSVDTYAEPSSIPAATASLKDKIGLLHAQARNKMTNNGTTIALRNDADSGNIGTATAGESGGTFTRGEFS